MTDRAKKITELQSATSANSSAMVVVVITDPSGIAVTKKMSVGNLFGNTSANVVLTSSSPANSSSLVVKQGTVFYNANYMFIAVSDNVVKRVALESF